jgi:transcriptional regulator of arginine metabolism
VRTDRHKKILELINNNNIGTQEELADALNKAGYNVTQATVSRDIRALNLTKVSVDGVRQKYTTLTAGNPVTNDKYIRVLKEGFIDMDMAQNILVIRTVSGMAMAVCAALDALKLDEIVGSIAGDDTIMCAVRTVKDTTIVMNKLRKLIKI